MRAKGTLITTWYLRFVLLIRSAPGTIVQYAPHLFTTYILPYFGVVLSYFRVTSVHRAPSPAPQARPNIPHAEPQIAKNGASGAIGAVWVFE
jgi:hypothetical protein